jgi:hypothetical protein
MTFVRVKVLLDSESISVIDHANAQLPAFEGDSEVNDSWVGMANGVGDRLLYDAHDCRLSLRP